jgi:hypothetical protein
MYATDDDDTWRVDSDGDICITDDVGNDLYLNIHDIKKMQEALDEHFKRYEGI